MSIFHIKKHLKKRWKKWRRAIWTAGACAMVALMALLGLPLSDRMEELMTNEPLAMETLGLWQEAESASEVIPEWREGYIGIDSNGNLSLFDGPPKQEKVIRTFFNWMWKRWRVLSPVRC